MRVATVQTDVPKYIVVRRAHSTGRQLNPEYIALWESYLDEGMAAKHVAELFGIHPATVRKYYPHKVWTYAQARELSLAMRNFNRQMQKAQGHYA